MPVNIKKARTAFNIDNDNIETKLLDTQKFSVKNNKATYKTFQAGYCQADLQFWNQDQGYKYLLVVVDIMTKRIDLEALKDKTQETIIKGMEEIFKRHYIFDKDGDYIVYPNIIMTDSGSEFGEKFIQWCTEKNIVKKTSRVARKQQTSVVEGYNYVISKILAIKTTLEQSKAKKRNRLEQRQWVKHLKKLREVLNDKEINEVMIKDFFKFSEKRPSSLLNIGDKVHVVLERPLDVQDNKLSGKFRIGDYRYEKTPRYIANRIYNLSGNPVRYVVTGINNATFSRNELLLDE